MGPLVIAASLLAVCYCAQRWSTARRSVASRTKRVDIPRWEGEGGSPAPDPEESESPGAARLN